jgi:hypothetical protein
MLGNRNTKHNVKAACLLDSVEGLVSIQGPGSGAAQLSGLLWWSIRALAWSFLFTFPWHYDGSLRRARTHFHRSIQTSPSWRSCLTWASRMARSNESPMDFTWDNKSGPLDPTSPFYKFATMKSMSSCKTTGLDGTDW